VCALAESFSSLCALGSSGDVCCASQIPRIAARWTGPPGGLHRQDSSNTNSKRHQNPKFLLTLHAVTRLIHLTTLTILQSSYTHPPSTFPSRGMTWTGFRASDDQSLGYNIPDNLFGIVALSYVKEMAVAWEDARMHEVASQLERDFRSGVDKFGVTNSPLFGEIYCYETTGLDPCLTMDDANVPSLLAGN
jgi:meiotically up-regulated gene 157 (Mug157) protein